MNSEDLISKIKTKYVHIHFDSEPIEFEGQRTPCPLATPMHVAHF